MDALLRRIEGTIRREGLVVPGARILLALSGGRDSTALFHLLRLLAGRLDFRFETAHLDHAFRDGESLRDRDFSAALAARFSVPFHTERIDVPALCRPGGGSPQMVARSVRYAFLERTALRTGCTVVALAHTRDDLVETFLLKLFQGVSPAGMAAMPLRRGMFIRPLLEVSGTSLSAFLARLGEGHIEDSSNRSPHYCRNRLRHRILPHLERLWPGLRERIPRLVTMLDAENRYWEERIAALDPLVGPAGWRFSLAQLRQAPLPLVGRALVVAIQQVAPGHRLPAARFFLRLPEWLGGTKRSFRSWLVSPGLAIQQEGEVLWVRREPLADAAAFSLALVEGVHPFPWGTLTVSRARPACLSRKFFQEQAKYGIFWIDRTTLVPPLWVRSRQPGDRIRLAGGFSKKLKDLLIAARVPLRERRACLVVGDAAGILACLIPGDPGKSRLAERALFPGIDRVAAEKSPQDGLEDGTALVLTLVVHDADGGNHAR